MSCGQLQAFLFDSFGGSLPRLTQRPLRQDLLSKSSTVTVRNRYLYYRATAQAELCRGWANRGEYCTCLSRQQRPQPPIVAALANRRNRGVLVTVDSGLTRTVQDTKISSAHAASVVPNSS